MHDRDKNYFELLKQNIVATMQQSYPGINPSIADWKGQEIINFQEDLIIKVNAHISEKWFYNHIKSDNQTLPRIDVLNLLSKYTGCINWDDFVYKNTGQLAQPFKNKKANRYFVLVPLLVISMVAILFFLFKVITARERSFTFYDAQTREAITGCQIEIKILSEDESPVNYFSDSTGNFVFKTDKSVLKLVVSAPYYHTDTITRILKSFEKDHKISLMPNDYALIIHYFSETKVDDWQKRRSILSQILDDKAMIYQVMNDLKAPGMELLNKNEFIDKLTMPAESLKNIEILETKFKDDKILVLRFRINDSK